MKTRQGIKAVAVVTLAALATAACGSGGSETTDSGLTPISYQSFPQTVQNIPITVAQDQGFFEDNGLEVTVSDATNGPSMLAAVSAGKIDATGLPLFLGMQSIASGAPIKAVVGLSGAGGSVVFVSDRIPQSDDSYPESAQVIDGKTAAIAAPGGYSEKLLQRYTDEAGVSLEYVTLPGVAAQVAALKAGQVDVVNFDLVTAYGLEKQGLGRVLWDFQETGPDEIRGTATAQAWMSDQFLEENPEAADAFARAIAQATAWMAEPANAEKVAEYFSEIAGTEVAVEDLGPMITAMTPIVSAQDVEVYGRLFDASTEPPTADQVLSSVAPQDQAAVDALVNEK